MDLTCQIEDITGRKERVLEYEEIKDRQNEFCRTCLLC